MLRLLFQILCFKISIAEWIVSPQPLPNDNDEMAVGAWDGNILLFGGGPEEQQLTEIDTATKNVIDLGITGLSGNVNGGWSQYWTQIDHIVYVIDTTAPQLNIYNMIDRTFTTNWMGVTIPTNHYLGACLASDDEYLYVTGGYPGYDAELQATLTALQILTVSTQTWLNAPPSMTQQREEHACIVHNDYLWVFGGDEGKKTLSVNERISTIDILNNAWDHTIDPLTVAVKACRCIPYYDIIYVIGGVTRSSTDSNRQNIVHLVDAQTGTVTVLQEQMHAPTAWLSPIIWDSVLYVFGGFDTDGSDHGGTSWVYYPLPSPSGTDVPTVASTLSPVADPTVSPTVIPTHSLTDSPTTSPHSVVASPTVNRLTGPHTTNQPITSSTASQPITSSAANPTADETLQTTAYLWYQHPSMSKRNDISSSSIYTSKSMYTQSIALEETTKNITLAAKNNKSVIWISVVLIVSVCLLSAVSVYFLRSHRECHIMKITQQLQYKNNDDMNDIDLNKVIDVQRIQQPRVLEQKEANIQDKVTVEGVVDESISDNVHSKCIQCGATSKQIIEGVFVCNVCKDLDKDIDKDIDKMYDNDIETHTKYETTEDDTTHETECAHVQYTDAAAIC